MARNFGGVPKRRGPNQKTILLVVSAFFLAIFIILGVFLMKKGGDSSPAVVENTTDNVNMVGVLIPVREIEEGEKLSRDMFAKEFRSRFEMSDGHVSDLVQIDGRFARTLILPGQPLYREYVTQYSPNNPIVLKIPDGFRAISISVDATSGVEGWIRPGSLVDVQWITKVNGQKTLVKLVDRAEVLSSERSSEVINTNSNPEIPTTVTLLVSTGDADKVALARNEGKLNLVLRNYEEPPSTLQNRPIPIKSILNEEPRVPVKAVKVRNCQGRLVLEGKQFCVCNGEMLEPDKDGKC